VSWEKSLAGHAAIVDGGISVVDDPRHGAGWANDLFDIDEALGIVVGATMDHGQQYPEGLYHVMPPRGDQFLYLGPCACSGLPDYLAQVRQFPPLAPAGMVSRVGVITDRPPVTGKWPRMIPRGATS
jgi:hypothetical protein